MRLQYYDALTGSLNLEGFRRESGRLFPSRATGILTMYCDIKNFKYINDLFGFHTGNLILKYWASCLKDSCREDEAFCRISDDNFAFLWRLDEQDRLRERFNGLADRLASFGPFEEKNYQVELISGVYIPENPCGMDIDEMLNRANMARKSIVSPRGSRILFLRKNSGKSAGRDRDGG